MESDPRAIQVHALLKEGHSQRFVARVLKMRPETVGRIARDEPSAPPKNPGRPTKTTSEIRAFVDTQWSLDATITDEQMGRLISENFGTSVARTTVGRVRRDLRFMYRPPKAIQALTDEQKQARIDFCRWVLQNRHVEEVQARRAQSPLLRTEEQALPRHPAAGRNWHRISVRFYALLKQPGPRGVY